MKTVYRNFTKQKAVKFYFIPRFWVNRCNNPNFQHYSIVLRWMKFYYGYEFPKMLDICE